MRTPVMSSRPWFLALAGASGLLVAQAGGCGSSTTKASATGASSTSSTSSGSVASTSTGGSGGTPSASTSTSTSSGTGGGAVGTCGDGIVEGSEQCDLGAANGTGIGCNSSCGLDCSTDAECNTMNDPCLGMATCIPGTAQGQAVKTCMPGTPLATGASCGTNLFCVNMNCILESCGDGVVEAPEECDNGGANGPGAGCENDCKLSCLASDPTRNCASKNPCVSNGTCGTAHTCTAGTALADGAACPNGTCQTGVCVVASCTGAPACAACAGGLCSGSPAACVASTCGDGCVDASKGEQCEPPSTATCDASCKLKPAVCGDGVLQVGEQCDDGNTFDLDGCDAHCNYEAVARMTSVAISGSPAPASLGCTPATNRLGAQALTSAALTELNGPLKADVANGAVNVLMQLLALSDLNGVSSTPFSLGVLDGTPDGAKGNWPAAGNPIDWWFLADQRTVSMGLPTGLFTNVTLKNRTLVGGPNDVTVTLNLGGSPAVLSMKSAHIGATIDGNPPPNVPQPPPSSLEAGLTVFQLITANGAGQGLCGNITVASLAQIPVPVSIAMGGTAACSVCPNSHTYTYCGDGNPVGPGCNSLLDVLVGGCGLIPVSGACIVAAVNPEQPDVPSGSTVTKLAVGGPLNKVTTDVSTDEDAYSAYLTFTANRAHFTGETCAVTADCQTGKTCTSGVCK